MKKDSPRAKRKRKEATIKNEKKQGKKQDRQSERELYEAWKKKK